jgi:hypothetical protein
VTGGPDENVSRRGLYLYGVVPAGEREFPAQVAGVDRSSRVFLLEHRGLAAVVSEVSLEEFGESALRENLNRLDWLEAHARAHEGVLERALVFSALLPTRLATIYRDEAQVRGLLEREHDRFSNALEKLRGAREWGVRVFVARDRLAQWIEGAFAESPAAPASPGGGGEGAAYFARKKHEAASRARGEEVTAKCARRMHEALSAEADDARTIPVQRTMVPAEAGELVLNGVYLVRREGEGRFRGVLQDLEGEYRDLGVRVDLTGPWPPYNFVEPDEGSTG